jgi:hypothetical protein
MASAVAGGVGGIPAVGGDGAVSDNDASGERYRIYIIKKNSKLFPICHEADRIDSGLSAVLPLSPYGDFTFLESQLSL